MTSAAEQCNLIPIVQSRHGTARLETEILVDRSTPADRMYDTLRHSGPYVHVTSHLPPALANSIQSFTLESMYKMK